jgi:anti-sigma B factor antagonist
LSHLREYHDIETVTHDEYYEVIVAGELDVYTVPELEEVLMPMRQEGLMFLQINLIL